jgi:hypothetical protein
MRKGKRSRKTVNVVDLVRKANDYFRNSIDSEKQGRKAIALFLADVLMTVNKYNGFNYLSKEMMERNNSRGTTVGIRQVGEDPIE